MPALGESRSPLLVPPALSWTPLLLHPCAAIAGSLAVDIYGSFEAVAAGKTSNVAALKVDAAEDGKSLQQEQISACSQCNSWHGVKCRS